jgi:hypothetical protein
MYDSQKHSPGGAPVCVFRFDPMSGGMHVELVPLIFVDRQPTLRPIVQGNVEQYRNK